MEPREAFEAIRRAIASDHRKQIVNSRYDEQAFGNFIISFRDNGRPRSVVNDRFELVLCENVEGDGGTTLLRSIEDADAESILHALGL